MGFLIKINKSIILSIIYFKDHRSEISNYYVLKSLNVVLFSAKSVGLDEMQHHAAFHLGLHCLSKYPFKGFQYTVGLLCGCKQLIGIHAIFDLWLRIL